MYLLVYKILCKNIKSGGLFGQIFPLEYRESANVYNSVIPRNQLSVKNSDQPDQQLSSLIRFFTGHCITKLSTWVNV